MMSNCSAFMPSRLIVTMGACPTVTMGRPKKSLKVTLGGRRPDAYNLTGSPNPPLPPERFHSGVFSYNEQSRASSGAKSKHFGTSLAQRTQLVDWEIPIRARYPIGHSYPGNFPLAPVRYVKARRFRPLAASTSFASERHHRIHFRCTAGRQPAGEPANNNQQNAYPDENDGVVRRCLIEEASFSKKFHRADRPAESKQKSTRELG
jgi:hypothetical protein